jgi:hypothetical protein
VTEENTNQEKGSIDTTKDVSDAEKKESKAKKQRGRSFRPYMDDMRTRLA